jgi:hypothetical protein
MMIFLYLDGWRYTYSNSIFLFKNNTTMVYIFKVCSLLSIMNIINVRVKFNVIIHECKLFIK